MVSDTRSARKSKDEARKSKDEARKSMDAAQKSKDEARKSKDGAEGSSSTKKKVNIRQGSSVPSPGKADVARIKRSARETSLSRHTMPSPQSTRKSKRLEKEPPSLTPPVKRKSERLEKYNTPSPLRRSDRGMKKLSPSVSGFKQSAKELKLPESKRKKEKTLIQVTMESEKAEPDLEAVGMKRKKMNARSFKALFKRQRVKEIVPDGDRELEGQDKSSHVCSGNSRGIGSGPDGNEEDDSYECSRRVVEKLRDESIEKASDGAIQNSIYSIKGCHADINVDSSLRENIFDEPCSKYSQNSSSLRESFDGSERLPTNCSSSENMDAPESGSSPYLAKPQGGSVSMESSEKLATPSASSTCENHNLLGTCVQCSKNKRVGYDSPEQELCSCSPMVDECLGSFSTCKDRSDYGGAVPSESAGAYNCRHSLTKMREDSQLDGHENVCALCNKDGELLCCEGKGCKRCFHFCCLDPPLTDALPGVWYCPQCVKKKLLFGVHSVSQGVDLICDVREVEVSNAKEVRQRQYLVKYHGLAHIHNLWVPVKQLLLENPSLASNFSEKDQNVRWNAEWMVPHRLLMKRSIQEKIYIASSADISVCNYEWLVKWHGLSYAHATWELDNAYFLNSSVGQSLMKDYETRRQKARQEVNKCHSGSIFNVSELPANQSHANKNYVLKNVNRLRECLFQCQNAVVLDDQERAMTVTLFIQSMTEICRPFLFVTTSSSLSQWEAEFARLVPSVDVVVYSGNNDTRKGIRASEFYEEGGCVMLQVLLSSAEAVFEDLDILRTIRWEAIVIDEYQHNGISHDLEQIKTLATNSRILLVRGQIKDTTSECLKMLTLLESPGDFDKLRGLRSETSDNLCKLKDRLSRFIAYGSTSQVSKFLEYWVPVQISNYQLEQYCATLLSNSIPLRSCSKNDPVGAVRDTLLTVRKCCDHPYLLDSSVQGRLIAEQRPAAEFLEIGIKASGKLQLLDKMLTEIKARGLQVLILFQLIIGSGGASTGDILDDFLRQRFGQYTYERVDAGITPSKKQAAVNRFNKKETGQFAFLLENRACSSIIKLSSLDMVIMYDSDWNPTNDLRALQKISIDVKVEQIKVFRLYSSFTVEERALVLAKQNLNLDNNLPTFSRTTSSTLLSWGATYLFSKLDEYHLNRNSTSDLNFSSEQVLFNEVIKEFQAILSGSREDTDSNSVILEVKLGVGSYSTNGPMLGEAKVQFKDGEEPHVFWRNLLDGRSPQWIHLRAPSPRNRKRVNYLDASPSKPETEKDDVVKKRKKMVTENLDPALVQVELEAHQVTQVADSRQGPSTIKACNNSQNFQEDSITSNNNPNGLSGQSSVGAGVYVDASAEGIVSTNEQKSLHGFLQGEMMKLCQILKLSEDVTHTVRKFLEYVIKNHHINSDSPPIVQAFLISLCWTAASIAKQKVDKKDSLMLAKQLLNYQCTEEQVNSVYSKMRSLKRMYLQCSEGGDCLSAEEDISKAPFNDNEGGSQFSSYKQKNSKNEIGERLVNEEHANEQIQKSGLGIDNLIKKKKEKCDKRMKKLTQKHQEEMQEYHRTWEEKRLKFETDHKLESAFIRSIHGQGLLRMEKLKLLEENFAKKIEEHNLLKDAQLKDLEAKQLAAMNKERQKATFWLAKKKALYGEPKAVNGPQSLGSQSEDGVGGLGPNSSINFTSPGDVYPMSEQHGEDQNPSTSFSTRGNDIAPSSVNEPSEAIGLETPVQNLAPVNSQNEVGVMSSERSSLAMAESLNQSKASGDHGETVSANLPPPVGQCSDEIQPVDLTEDFPIDVPKTVPNETGGHVDPVDLSDTSKNKTDKASNITSPDALVNQGDADEEVSGDLHTPGLDSEQMVSTPDCGDLLQPQVQQDKMGQSLVSSELHDQDAAPVENQCTSRIEMRTSELVDTVSTLPTDVEAPAAGEMVTPVPVPSIYEAPVTENSGQLHPVSVDVRCNQFAAMEDQDRSTISSQTVESGGREVLPHESVSLGGESLEIHSNHLDVGPSSGVAHGQSVESSGVSQNDVTMPQLVITAERPTQAVPQLGIDAGHLRSPSYLLAHPTNQPSSWNSTPSLFADPLQNELERIRKETEQLEKKHQDLMSQLKSDCEEDIQEIITQIRKKYEVKFQEAEAEFRFKWNEIDKNQNKVLMNKKLADAVRSKCQDVRPPGFPSMQQGLMHHLHQLSQSTSTRPSASQPGPSRPAQQTTQQQLSQSHSVRAVQSVTAPHIHTVQQSAALLSGTSSRPPVISAITPAGNPRVAGEVRAPAPHLQFRPVPATSIPTAMPPSVSQPCPSQVLPSQPPPAEPSPPPLTNLVSQNRRDTQGDLSIPGLVMDPNHRTSSPLPEICSFFRPLELSDLEMLGNVQCYRTSDAAADVVCLSDDD